MCALPILSEVSPCFLDLFLSDVKYNNAVGCRQVGQPVECGNVVDIAQSSDVSLAKSVEVADDVSGDNVKASIGISGEQCACLYIIGKRRDSGAAESVRFVDRIQRSFGAVENKDAVAAGSKYFFIRYPEVPDIVVG